MSTGFKSRVVLITGASGALGRAVAEAFREEGARLVLIDRTPRGAGEGELHLTVDLTDAKATEEGVSAAIDRFGPIDALVNVAGGFAMGPAFHETGEDVWERMLDINARTTINACRAVIPRMLEAGGGKVVNVAARAALEGKAKMAPYVVSKAAVVRLTESLAAEYRDKNINVNCVLPGTIDTPQNRADMPKAKQDRWVAPAAIAEVIRFLASDSARAVHGAAIPVYGLS